MTGNLTYIPSSGGGGGNVTIVGPLSGGAVAVAPDIATDAGVIDALTQRVTLASDQPSIAVKKTANVFTFSTVNSSAAQLAAGATFTGVVESVVDQPAYSVLLVCDQPGTLTITQFIDAAGAQLVQTQTFSVLAGAGFARSFTLNGNFMRVAFQNTGGSTTTTFRLDTAFGDILPATQLNNVPMSIMEVNGTTYTLGSKSPALSMPTVLSSKDLVSGVQYAAGTAVLNLNLLNGVVSGWLDVSAYNSAVLTVTTGAGISAGVIQFEETNDTTAAPNGTIVLGYNTATQNANPISSLTLAASQTSSVYLPLRARFFRCRVSTAVAGGTVQAFLAQSQFSFAPTNYTVNQATAASLNATIAAIPAGTSAIGDTGTQYRNTATGAASFVSVISPVVPAAGTIKAAAGRVIGWQFQNSAATLRSVKVFGVAAPTLGTTAALFEIDIPAGGAVFMNFPGGVAFGTAATYSVTSAKGLTDNTSATLALGDVSGAFFFA